VITAEQRVKLMELLDMAKLIKNYFPKKAVEISATLELLRDIMEDTREEIKKQIMLLFDKGLHEDMIPHNQLAAAMLLYMQRLQEIQALWNWVNNLEWVQKRIKNYDFQIIRLMRLIQN
jgi:AcrR family transcriptional regulator